MSVVVILAALQLAVPIHCHTNQTEWNQSVRALGLTPSVAYYDGQTRTIGLSPAACKDVQRPTIWGANVLAHELAHAWQHANGLPLNEGQANRIARWAERGVLARLVQVLGRPALIVKPDVPVVLTP